MTGTCDSGTRRGSGRNHHGYRCGVRHGKFEDASFTEHVDSEAAKRAADLPGWSAERIAELTVTGLHTVLFEARLMGEE